MSLDQNWIEIEDDDLELENEVEILPNLKLNTITGFTKKPISLGHLNNLPTKEPQNTQNSTLDLNDKSFRNTCSAFIKLKNAAKSSTK